MKNWLVIAVLILIVALAYLYYAGSDDKSKLSDEFKEARAIPIVIEFSICVNATSLQYCQNKIRACGLSAQDNGNDWKNIGQDTALKCANDLAPNEAAGLSCSDFVAKTYALSLALDAENPLILKLIGSPKITMLTNETLNALGNCMAELGFPTATDYRNIQGAGGAT